MQLGTGDQLAASIDRRPVHARAAGTLALAAPDRDGRMHVSAASGLAAWGGAAWVVSDEYGELVRFDSLAARGTLLPGLRHHKKRPDLESILAVPQAAGGALLVAFGSGSKANGTRDRALVQAVDGAGALSGAPVEADLGPLYDALRRQLADRALNVEGLALRDGAAGAELLVFHRGQDAGQVNTIFRLDATRAIEALRAGGRLDSAALLGAHQLDLGTIGGQQLGFADAHVLADGRVAFVASGERADGTITGSVVGLLDSSFAVLALRPLDGPARKVEGLQPTRTLDPTASATSFTLVTDPDDAARAAEVLVVDLAR